MPRARLAVGRVKRSTPPAHRGFGTSAIGRVLAVLAAGIAVVACAPLREPLPITPPEEAAGAAVVRRPVTPPTPPTPAVVARAAPTATAPAAPAPVAPVTLPPSAIYVCVSDAAGVRQQTAIEFSPRVGELCRRHPEMGPCQYERDVCRRSGGRVYAAGGVEITQATEAEYDRKVMRVRFRGD